MSNLVTIGALVIFVYMMRQNQGAYMETVQNTTLDPLMPLDVKRHKHDGAQPIVDFNGNLPVEWPEVGDLLPIS